MKREEADFIGAMNMCDEISNEAYKKIMCHCEEQEPCEDAVSRSEIQQKINRLWNSDGDKDYCMETLRDFVAELPSVTPKGVTVTDFADKCRECGKQKTRWIPVSERLPKEGQRVLVTQIVGERTVVYCTRFPFEKTKDKYITAWQPLPKPYKVEKESEE